MLDNRGPALVLSTLMLIAALPAGAQCTGTLAEVQPPPAVRFVAAADDGFVVRYWAWDDFNRRRGGDHQPILVDSGNGVLLADLDWGAAEVCEVPGPVDRTAVLVEALGADGFGRWALVNLGAGADGHVDVDVAQHDLGQVWSRAVAVPSPEVESLTLTADTVEVELAWEVDWRGEELSDLVGELGQPLPSVRGFAVYLINGPAATPRPWDWSHIDDLEADAVNGFSTDAHATLVLPRSLWSDVTVCFAVALTFDGNGDAEGELPDSRSVHGSHLGLPSPWHYLPPLGEDLPAALVGLEARPASGRLRVSWSVQSAPAGASYRLWARPAEGREQLLSVVETADVLPRVEVQLPRWCQTSPWALVVEMVDADGRVVAAAETVPVG